MRFDILSNIAVQVHPVKAVRLRSTGVLYSIRSKETLKKRHDRRGDRGENALKGPKEVL